MTVHMELSHDNHDVTGPVRAPLPTVRRLPAYLGLLRKYAVEGALTISSASIAAELGLEPIQVRKDLQITGLSGQPGVGFSVEALIDAIELFLGWDNATDAFIVGAGNLGSALAGYDGFALYGLNIVALFDNDPAKVGTEIHGRPVFHIDRLIDLAWRMHVHLGILAVSSTAAQQAADLMADAGLQAVWNFTPVQLKMTDGIIVEKVDLAASLAVLSNRLATAIKDKRGVHNADE